MTHEESRQFSVELQNPYEFESLPELTDIQMWCISAIQNKDSADKSGVVVRVVDDAESAELNQSYRGKQGPTNVLSFPNELPEFMLDIPELNQQMMSLGDLVVCEPLLRQEALEQGKEVHIHWAHLIIHGVLHLQGYDHIDDQEAMVMERLEIDIMEKLGFDNPYQ